MGAALGARWAALRVAERKCRDPRRQPANDRQHEHKPPGKRDDATPGKRTHDPASDANQQPSEQERNQAEGNLQREPKQKARLECSAERRGLGAEQALGKLLDAESKQR